MLSRVLNTMAALPFAGKFDVLCLHSSRGILGGGYARRAASLESFRPIVRLRERHRTPRADPVQPFESGSLTLTQYI